MPKINYDLKASAHVSCLQLIDENAKTQRAVQNFQCLNTSLPATSISLLLNRVLCVHLDRSLCLNCAKKYVTHLFIVLATMQIDMMVEKRRMDRKGMKKNKMSAGADVHVISWDLICPPFCSVCCRCCRPTGLFCCSLVSGETEIQIHGDLLPRPRHVSHFLLLTPTSSANCFHPKTILSLTAQLESKEISAPRRDSSASEPSIVFGRLIPPSTLSFSLSTTIHLPTCSTCLQTSAPISHVSDAYTPFLSNFDRQEAKNQKHKEHA